MIGVILDIIKNWGFLVLIIFTSNLSAGTENFLAGARSIALSHASVSFCDTWAVFHNQAGLTGVSGISAGFYFESKFGIDELSMTAGSVIMPINRGAFGISLYQFGKGIFRENKMGLAYAHRLSEKWSAGLQLDYFAQLYPENEHAMKLVTFEGGILLRANEQLHLGAHVFNPVKVGFNLPSGRQEMPVTIRAGGHYKFDKAVLVVFEVEKENLHPPLFKSGLEFLPAENFAIRIGASGKPVKYTGGFGYRTGCFSADLGFSYHANLGFTPSLSVQFDLK